MNLATDKVMPYDNSDCYQFFSSPINNDRTDKASVVRRQSILAGHYVPTYCTRMQTNSLGVIVLVLGFIVKGLK